MYIISDFSSCPDLKNYTYHKNKSLFKAYSFYPKTLGRQMTPSSSNKMPTLYSPV